MSSEYASLPAPIGTMIYGSCVTRDTFEFLGDDFLLKSYVARQSVISAGTQTSDTLPMLDPIASAFQKRMVEGDLKGNLYETLDRQASQADLLVIDLIDERGGVIDFGDGKYVSKLAEFWSAGGREASRGRAQISFGSDEHFERWTNGVQRLLGELLKHEMLHRTVVIKAPWATLTDTDEPFDIPTWMMDPREANSLYERYYDYLEKVGVPLITLPDHLVRTSDSHQWGVSPYHYAKGAYEYLATELRRFVLSLRAPHHYEGLPRRNPAPWGEFTHLTHPGEFSTVSEANGLFTITHNGLPIDLMVEDNGSNTTLVSFSAALGQAPLDPPIFTGRAASADLGMNRVFVSDPGLLCSEVLGLAWYLGTKQVNLTQRLVEIIQALQDRLGAEHLVFFGMSGGGFASLNISHEFPGSLAVPVNPQTRILDYAKLHWQSMAEACFGVKGEDGALDILEAHHRADQRHVYNRGYSNTVIYVQNSQDSHVTYQMIPWLEAIEWKGDVHVLAEKWGDGHVPPKPEKLRQLLGRISEVDGDWASLARTWRAKTQPTRAWVKEQTGR